MNTLLAGEQMKHNEHEEIGEENYSLFWTSRLCLKSQNLPVVYELLCVFAIFAPFA